MNGPARLSLVSTCIILAIGGAAGLMLRGRVSDVRREHGELAARAVSLGLREASATDPDGTPVTKRARDGADAARASAASTALIAFTREMEQWQKNGSKADDAFEKRSMEMMAKLMELDSVQLKQVVANLRDDPSLTDESRRSMIGFSILMLGEDHPAAALGLYVECADILNDGVLGPHVITSTLSRWAKEDPRAALAWMRANGEAHPEVADDGAKTSIISGVAEIDPKEAFKLLQELQPEDPASAIQALVETGKSPEARTAILDALRTHAATLGDDMDREDIVGEALEDMARNLTGETFDSVTKWVGSAKLNPEETVRFAGGLSYFNTKEDTGRWIDWMAKNLPTDEIPENVDNLIGQWTQQDYLAAGKWLAASTDGPAKNAAVSTYAETVAEYEPQTAVQWAMTLPEGKDRRNTLEAIYHNWPKSDAAAGEAFAKQHGIDTSDDDEDDSTEEP
ncbi:MAG: hypothetical protein EOP88_16540 [Verrucomicrobiaceae bacterium]|nr:MAG: hypothetical protein EOP88_16540 [Verrucomicrobiaceae bacterium]